MPSVRTFVLVIVALTAATLSGGLGQDGRRAKPEGRPLRAQQRSGAGWHRRSPRRGGFSVGRRVLPRNLAEALRRVEQNGGAAGIDGMSMKEPRPWSHDHWPEIRSQLLGGHLPAAARQKGDDAQACGWAAEAGDGGCAGSVDLPASHAGARAFARPAFPSLQLRGSPRTLGP